jgi:hypothetical protein
VLFNITLRALVENSLCAIEMKREPLDDIDLLVNLDLELAIRALKPRKRCLKKSASWLLVKSTVPAASSIANLRASNCSRFVSICEVSLSSEDT